MEVEGKVVIITGASRGIGRGIAKVFARKGAKLVLAARNIKDLEETRSMVEKEGGDALVVKCDVTSEDDVKNMLDTAEGEYGKIDILINNAGVVVRKNIADTTNDDYNLTMDVNVRGVFYGCREFVKRYEDGMIINVSSNLGMRGLGGHAVYSASKFAVNGLTESIVQEWGGYSFAVCPGPVNTDMHDHRTEEERSRMDQPEDIGERILYICRNPDGFRNGSAVNVWMEYWGK